MAGVGLLWLVAWLAFVRPVAPLDFHVFVAGAHAVARGQNPYPDVGTAAVWSGSAFVYPWLTAWLFVPAAALSLHAAALVMSVVSVAAVAAGVWAVNGPRLVPFACVLFASPTLDGLQMGTLNALLFLGLCLAWRWRDDPARVGVTIAVLITLKIFCWPLVLWLIATRRRPAALWAAGGAGLLLGGGWVFGPLGPVAYVKLLGQLGVHETGTSSGLQGMLVQWSLPAPVAQLIGVSAAVALALVLAKRSERLAYAATVVSTLLASPVVWHHYYLLAAAPALLVRNGAWLYLVVGWASVPARHSYGVSWHFVTVAAELALLLGATVIAYRRRRELLALVRRHRVVWIAVAGTATVAVIVATAGVDSMVRGLAQSSISVGGCLALLLLAEAADDLGRTSGSREIGPRSSHSPPWRVTAR